MYDRPTPAEGYQLQVTPGGIRLLVSAMAGAFYAFQTLRQLLPFNAFALPPRKRRRHTPVWAVPAVDVVDWPRYAWRGLMLDSVRHYYSVEHIKHLLGLMALHKLNVFHWHLTDDQGWRIEIMRFPELVQVPPPPPGAALPCPPPPPPLRLLGGGGQRPKKITVLKIGLKFPAPLINFIFCRRKIFLMLGGRAGLARAPNTPPPPPGSLSSSLPPPPPPFNASRGTDVPLTNKMSPQ